MKETLKEIKSKEERLMDCLVSTDYYAAVIGRQDNFAWLTCGAHHRVLLTSEIGVSLAIITADGDKYLIAKAMDGKRIVNEELIGLGFKLEELKWYEESCTDRALKILEGKKCITDTPLPGLEFNPGIFEKLHYPLTETEMDRMRSLGRETEETALMIANDVKPGDVEKDIYFRFISEFAKRGIECTVVLVGSDDRLYNYRHYAATDKKIDKYFSFALAVQKWGLNMPLTRSVYFGDKIPDDIAVRYDGVCRLEAVTIANTKPGIEFSELTEIQKKAYAETEFTEEWKGHFMGGLTGYVVNDPAQCFVPGSRIEDRQAFNWYLTISGAKIEETMLLNNGRSEIVTQNGIWPVKKYSFKNEEFLLPQILTK